MKVRQVFMVVAGTALAFAPAGAQSLERRAVLTGGGPGGGRCTGEVVVDGAAEVEIRGDMASLRDLSGRPPEWRRFECTSAMPPRAANIQFSGEGRGRQRMIRSPQDNNGVAVVRIEDSDPGANVYRFVLSWSEPGMAGGPPPPPMGGRFTTDQAVQVCRDAIRQQAMDRFGARQVMFRRINMDDNPGRNDWVVGMVEMRRPDGMEEHRRFSCSVNFDNGRVRSANIEGTEGAGPGMGGGAERDVAARQIEACQQAVTNRMRNEGYGRIDFGDSNVDNRYGNDRVTGTVRARGGFVPQMFDFSCSVTPGGAVRSTDVRKRQ